MAEQQTIAFVGPLEQFYLSEKVIKFVVQGKYFIGYERSNKAVTLLKDILNPGREGTMMKVEIPVPAKISLDKQTNIEQLVLTNHTKIYLEDQLIFFPAEQQQELENLETINQYVTEQEQEKNQKEIDKQITNIPKKQYLPALPKQLSRQGTNQPSALVLKKGNTYFVAGKEIPDAPYIEKEINKLVEESNRIINLYIIDFGKDDEKAWAKVRCEDQLTKQIKEDGVIHHYNTVFDAYLLDLITAFEEQRRDRKTNKLICPNNPILDIDDHNKPILTAEAKRQLAIRILKFKQFAERDAITKAASRAYLKMLNREWRDADEIQHEQFEIEMVNTS